MSTATALWLVCGGDWTILTDHSDYRWLVMGDRAFGLMGWFDYLRHDWSIPLQTSAHYVYPLPNNVALSDSNPLLAIVAKIFSGSKFSLWHPYGYWLIFCFSMQAFVAALLAQRLLAPSFLLRFVFTLFAATSPPLLARNGHLALMGHWIILVTFLLGTMDFKKYFWINYLTWMILTVCAAMIHPYWPPMILVMATCIFGYQAWIGRTKSIHLITRCSSAIFGLIVCALAGFWMIGILGEPKPIDNIHIYTSDILMHFNSFGWSPFIPALFKFRSGQYEGFAYIGAGSLLILLLYTLKKWIFRDHTYSFKKFINPAPALRGVSIGCFCLFIWSLGAKVRLLGFTMGYLDFIYEPLLPILGTFRSVGRFAWASHYLIILLLFLWLSHLWLSGWRKSVIALVSLAAIIQFAEMKDKAGTFFVRNTSFSTLEKSDWSEFLKGKNTIELVPPEIPGTPCHSLKHDDRDWLALAILAVENGLKFNSGTRANPPEAPGKAYCESLEDTLTNGPTNPLSAYVVAPWADPKWVKRLNSLPTLRCYDVRGGYTVCI